MCCRRASCGPIAGSADSMSAPVSAHGCTGSRRIARSTEREALSSEVRERVAEAMQELSPAERTAFVLRHFEGMCIEEVSRVLDCKPGAAKHSVFRAVQKLRRALEPL